MNGLKHVGAGGTVAAGFIVGWVRWTNPELPDPGFAFGLMAGGFFAWLLGSLSAVLRAWMAARGVKDGDCS